MPREENVNYFLTLKVSISQWGDIFANTFTYNVQGLNVMMAVNGAIVYFVF